MDMTLYALLNKKIKGAVSGIDSVQVQGQKLIFNFKNGTSQTMTFPTPADGISVKDLTIDNSNHLICELSDNTLIDAGLIHTIEGKQGPAGKDGTDGTNGIDGQNGKDGTDGISPIVTITEATGRHTISITDKDGVHSFVIKDGSALDTDNYYTKDEVIAELDKKANIVDIPVVPTNISELANDEGYIKNTVDNLIHYYNKADTYTQTEVNTLISNINKLTSQIVNVLPTEDISTSVIYLVRQGETNNYMQYMYINSAWAELGTTQVDLTDYYKKSEIDTKLADKADKDELPTVPTLVSAFTNDAGYITDYTETDPTVPAWAKATTKPTYTAAEVGALPEDTEIPIFTNKEVLDKISADKVTDWDGAATTAHTHDNKEILDKFEENAEGKVLYNNKPLASDNLWNGTKAEYDAIVDKDPNKTYVVTDEEPTLADYILDDTTTSTNKTWSSEKIKNEFTSLDDNRIVDLSSAVTVNTDIAAGDPIIHICRKGFTVYLRIEFTYSGNATTKTTTLISGLPQKYTPSTRIISPLVEGFSPTSSTMYGSRLWVEADGTVKISETDMIKDTNARFAFTYLVI